MTKSDSQKNMIDWWKKVVFENYANFEGRARRSEYWYFALIQLLILLPLYGIGIYAMIQENQVLSYFCFGLLGIYYLATLIPGLAVAVRRLHDTNKSGWMYLISFIPLIGSIILLVWFFTEGNRFANQYGEDPKNPESLVFDFERNSELPNP